MNPFLITGCGRSGTRYMGDYLSVNGIPTGWERVLTPSHPENRPFEARSTTINT